MFRITCPHCSASAGKGCGERENGLNQRESHIRKEWNLVQECCTPLASLRAYRSPVFTAGARTQRVKPLGCEIGPRPIPAESLGPIRANYDELIWRQHKFTLDEGSLLAGCLNQVCEAYYFSLTILQYESNYEATKKNCSPASSPHLHVQ